ncbi:E3 ubiquitin-protein ligase SINA-like 10 [Morella rubra]|uniref:E3 ubiquitin-protein ligase SINA-like 10 n=1 Tax=Morella rubra TaxID=262757 RepID=A0A6A1VEH4_9ROSI|nr:E3 ubiquitin-protein ligase SINA-like 10 [Morella rubra]
MAKFSLGGDEDGEGPSSPRPKRVRISVQSSVVYGDYQELSEEEEEEEEGEEEEEISSPVEVEGSSAEEDEEEEEEEDEEEEEEAQQVQEADRACPVTVGSRANGGGQVCPEGSITVTLTDPEVLDCCICYEPLSTPIFQVLSSST